MKKRKGIILFFSLVAIVLTGKAQTWAWARSGDGNGADEGYGICTDTGGNVFITGDFTGSTIAFGSYTLTYSDSSNVYLAKYDANGNALWAKSSSGSSRGSGLSVATDGNGNAYMTGSFWSPSITLGSFTLTNTGNNSLFLAKYDGNGNVLWARSATGSSEGLSVCTETTGNIFITGYFESPSIVFGSYTLTGSGTSNVFIVKYDAGGNVLWAKSANEAYGNSIITDAAGNSLITGIFSGSTIAFGTQTLNNVGNGNVFLAKYDVNGNVLWAKSTDGNIYAEGHSVTVDMSGNAYVTGAFQSPTIIFGSYTLTNSGNDLNMFLAKYDTNGNIIWAKNAKGNGGAGFSLSSDLNNIYVSGAFQDTLIIDTYTLVAPTPPLDLMFVARYDLNGNANYTHALSSGGADGNGICVDKFCNSYIVGDFNQTVGYPTFIVGTNTLTSTGTDNVFLAKLSFSNTCQPDGISQISNNRKILIFPNPNSGSFIIQMNDEIQNGEIILINSSGQKVLEQKIVKGESEINAKGISSGLFHYVILENKRHVGGGKLAIE